MVKTILVTGGAGFIGSHTVVHLINIGFNVVIYDNFCNSNRIVLDRIKSITGISPDWVEGDVRDQSALKQVFNAYPIDAVIHFAGLKSVSESVACPLDYYDNNVRGTLDLLAVMQQTKVKTLVFSSSATVYGNPITAPIQEDFSRCAMNPYGRSKLIIEDILTDLHTSDSNWKIAQLRYFNPVGAHETGLIGDDPIGIPNNLMPYITQVAVGRRDQLKVFGGDYPTIDGTGVRDYIHVCDLAEGHFAALDYLFSHGGLLTLNLGTGKGVSVLQLIHSFETVSGASVPYVVVDRRVGDVAECWASPVLAKQKMGWSAHRTLDQMCADAWRWQVNNPNGFCLV